MAKKFADLRAKMTPEARARSAAKSQALLGGFPSPVREKVARDATDEGLVFVAAGARPSTVISDDAPHSLAKHSASPPSRARGSTRSGEG